MNRHITLKNTIASRFRLIRLCIALAYLLAMVAGATPATPVQAEKWHTNPTGWWWMHGVTEAQINTKAQDGFRVIDIEIEQTAPYRFSAAFVKNTGVHAKTWWWYYGVSAEFISQKLNDDQARIIDLEPAWVDNQWRFAVVLVKNTGADAKTWWWYYGVTTDFISQKIGDNDARLVDIDSIVIGNTRYYNVIMIKNVGADASAWWWYYNVTPEFITDKINEHQARLIDIEKHGANTFTVIMERNTGKHWWWYYGISEEQVNNLAGNNGARVFDVEPYEVEGQKRFAVLMLNNVNALTTQIGDLLRNNTDAAAIGFFLKRVNGPTLAALQPTRSFYSASSMKALHNLHALRWAQIPIPNNPNPLAKLDTTINVFADSCANSGAQTSETLALALSKMMQNSDNDRTNAIQDFFGQAAINATAHDIVGMSAGTQLNSRFGSPCGGPGQNPPNLLTPSDIGLLYERVAKGELLTPPFLTVFHDLMLNESNNFFISTLIDQEADKLGMSNALQTEFKAAVKLMHKDGSWTTGGGVKWQTRAGWISLPIKSGGQTIQREYVYSLFIEEASSIANGFSAGDAVFELLRTEVSNALKTWQQIIGVLQPGQAGAFASNDGKVALSFPTGAVSVTVDLLHAPMPTPSQLLPAGSNGFYHFTLDAFTSAGDQVTQFDKPYTMRVDYNAADLAALNIPVARLSIVYWDGSAWVAAPSSIDSANQQIVAELDHFTEFALISTGEKRIYLPISLR